MDLSQGQRFMASPTMLYLMRKPYQRMAITALKKLYLIMCIPPGCSLLRPFSFPLRGRPMPVSVPIRVPGALAFLPGVCGEIGCQYV